MLPVRPPSNFDSNSWVLSAVALRRLYHSPRGRPGYAIQAQVHGRRIPASASYRTQTRKREDATGHTTLRYRSWLAQSRSFSTAYATVQTSSSRMLHFTINLPSKTTVSRHAKRTSSVRMLEDLVSHEPSFAWTSHGLTHLRRGFSPFVPEVQICILRGYMDKSEGQLESER